MNQDKRAISDIMYSIIVACYNIEKYIDECVESLIHQTYQHIQIILVDDGSTDETLKKCKSWAEKDSRIVVIHQKNAGSGATRNTGINNSEGQYLFFVDGDDIVDLHYVEKINEITEKIFPDAIITSHEYHFFENGKQVERMCFPIDKAKEANKYFLDFIFDGHYVVPGAVWHNVYRSDFIKLNNIYFGTYKLSQDLDFFYQVMFHKPVYIFSDAKYYYYRRREGSAVSSLTTEKILDRLCVIKKWWNCGDVQGVVTGEKMRRKISDGLFGNLAYVIPFGHSHIDYRTIKKEYLKDNMFASYHPGLAKCMRICGFRFTLLICKFIGGVKELVKMVRGKDCE